MRHRVIRHQLEPWCDPDLVFRVLYGQSDRAFWLDSGIGAQAGFSYLGEGARLVTGDSRGGVLTDTEQAAPSHSDIFEFLAEQQAEGVDEPAGAGGEFRLGWVGWFGYELRSVTMGTRASRHSRYPDAAWMEVVRAIEFDHASRTVTLVALAAGARRADSDGEWADENARWRDEVVATLTRLESRHEDAGAGGRGAMDATPEPRWTHPDNEYLAMIRECQRAIADGDAYQLCLTTGVEVDIRPDPLACYLALRARSPSHHGGLLRVGEYSLLSASPEVFLTVSASGEVESRPIKGTRPRGSGADDDAALRAELLSSDKERAENLMIVDLMRNDIARVSEVGSVTVPSLLAVESYAQVHQLVSTVRGQLRSDLRPMDAVVACFPAGSMTGAPKSSATAILDRLEGAPRGVYAGAFGYLGLDGRVELAMVIRSIMLDQDGATVGTGGGVTALSVPEEELAEARLKAAALLSVLGVR
jgi:anthranilate/para-aminobenzoate synthase component I